MNISYDSETDSLYIHLSAKPGADCEVLSDNIVIDLNEQGEPVGIDIQYASKTLKLAEFAPDGICYAQHFDKNRGGLIMQRRHQFMGWMVNSRPRKKLKESTAKNYCSAIGNYISKIARNKGMTSSSLWNISSNELRSFIDALHKNETFMRNNRKNHNQYTAALNCYLEFLIYQDSIGLKTQSTGYKHIANESSKIENDSKQPFVDGAGNTTKIGYINNNRQVCLGTRHQPENHPKEQQRTFAMFCLQCGKLYGANGCDVQVRVCPHCNPDSDAGNLKF